MRLKFLTSAALGLGFAVLAGHQALADAATEQQLRAALQASTAQIAQLEDQVANLQASQAPNVATIEALRAQLATLQAGGAKPAASGESAAEKAKQDAAMAALQHELSAQQSALSKSRSDYQAASGAASNAAAENDALKGKLASLQAALGSCHQANDKLYAVGNQILDAYSHKDDVFAGFANHEPFTGIKRVELENIVQADQDRLDDNHMSSP